MKGFSLWAFFVEGGWGMWSTLLFGVLAVGAAAWFARRPEPRRLAFTGAMWLTLVTVTAHATWTNVAAVCSYLEDPQRVPDAEITRTFFIGLKEASRPGALGGIFLTLVPILLGVGALRGRASD
ncbi:MULTISPECIES: hypothetical protein [Polyangium]|uniref:Uncharacterized protein n=2 Tax=Polyangium TaxID=55 RepID=A0A4U1J9G7_9BACT|nr:MULTISPECIES: hypothetical protein [Polyangium]MDI1436703.1 hypothetical protein [Polyangium sorediatum]TKD03522.1 hypothetical protein E8A74_25310 [Polyangium fumosum]